MGVCSFLGSFMISLQTFFKKKYGKQSLSYIHRELFTIRIVSIEVQGVE